MRIDSGRGVYVAGVLRCLCICLFALMLWSCTTGGEGQGDGVVGNADGEISGSDGSDNGSADGEVGATDDSGDATDSSADAGETPKEWVEVPLGTVGDLYRSRYLSGIGFRLVGASGSILRPVGDGWVREWVPFDTPDLRDITVTPGGAYHAVGHEGTWLERDEVGRWQAKNAGVEVDLHGVVGLPRAVVAVGASGTIIRHQYGNFIQEPSLVTHTLYAVASPGIDRAFAVGDAGLALRRHTSYGSCSDSSVGMCGTRDPAVEDACGEGTCQLLPGDEETAYCVQRCGSENGSCPPGFVCTDAKSEGFCEPNSSITWESLQAAATIRLRDLYALDLSSMWAVGDKATIMRYKPSTKKWQLELSNDGQKRDLYAVSGGSGMVLAAGDDGVFVRHQAGANNSPDSWMLVDNVEGPLLTTHRYQGIAIGSDRVVAAGEQAALQVQVIPDQPFRDGAAYPEGSIFDLVFSGDRGLAVGDFGVFVVWDDEGFGALDTGSDEPLYAAHVAADGSLIGAGAHGTLIHFSASGVLTHIPTGTTEDLRGIHSEEDGSLLLVGTRGVAVRIPPSLDSFTHENVDDPRDLLDLFEDGEHLTAVGRGGAIFRYASGMWEPVASGTTVDFHAGAHGGGRTVVVGGHGIVIGWRDDDAPEKLAEAPGSFHYGVYVDDAGDAFIAGWAGALMRLSADGVAETLEGPSKNTLRALVIRDGNLLVAGDKGALWEIGADAFPAAAAAPGD